MKWLKRKLRKWVSEAKDYDEGINVKSSGRVYLSEEVDATCSGQTILNFRVFPAVGGQVVEFRRYDRMKDENNTTTYIIQKDEDFGEKISKIANLELLK